MVRDRKPLPGGMLDNYITAYRPTVTEDRYGELTQSGTTTIATFWGDIKEMKSKTNVEQGKKRETRIIEVTARRRDVQNVDLDDLLSFGNLDEDFQVNDIYESDWKYGVTIIAEIRE